MHEIRWTPCSDAYWSEAQEARVGDLWLLVGIIRGWTWGIFKYQGGPRIIGGNCGSLEEALASVEDWLNANIPESVPLAPFCQECWIRHESDKPCYNG